MTRTSFVFVLAAVGAVLNPWAAAAQSPLPEGAARTLLLAPGDNNPRNSEGDFIQLADGRILFVYTHFTGGGGDHDSAHLAARESSDGGRTWTDSDRVILENEGGMNVMSVSLLRLQSGPIALFYLRKNATDDCRPVLRLSTDEAETWSDPSECITDEIGYYVVNNDRVIQLKSGRLVIPAAFHARKGEEFKGRSSSLCYLSDDDGKTWRRSATVIDPPADLTSGLQEPGVVELKDGCLMMLCRTNGGCQYRSWSEDGGDTWSPIETTDIMSPQSPATFERIPSTGDLLMAWNDHSGIPEELKGKRTPFTLAVSRDEGKTWRKAMTLEDDPNGWYCYTAMDFVDGAVLLGLCAGDRRNSGLGTTQVLRVDVDAIYSGLSSASPR